MFFETLSDLGGGFLNALSPMSLAFALLGVLIGTIVGTLPGIGPITAIAILIPVSFGLDPAHGLIMLCAIYYGSMYGGSISAALIKTPGEISNAVMALDGYQMARRGRARTALATAALGSFIAGTLAVIGLTFLSPVLVQVSRVLASPEYFLLMLLALVLASTLVTGSWLKSGIAVFIGLAVGTIGLDPQMGAPRQTFGLDMLRDGVEFTIFAMALFAVPEAIRHLGNPRGFRKPVPIRKGPMLNREDWRRAAPAWARGSGLGFVIGVLPGVGPTLAAFMSYVMEKRLFEWRPRGRKERFGEGAIEGVAGPEAANNGGVGGAMVPLLSLGIPGSATTALLLVVFIMYGLQPGPLMFEQESTLVWTIIASMYIGNLALLVLNLPLVGLFVKLLTIPPVVLYAAILCFVLIGAYAIEYSLSGLLLILVFGILGYGMDKFGIPLAPAILALVLLPLIESNYSQMMQISGGDLSVLVQRPVSLTIIIFTVLCVALPPMVRLLRRRGDRREEKVEVPA
ncbi:tripartite tricarboxylate transporter permease [Sediminivirga luteola]|uniref:tripartite tricarboxylate transporter permease n=1 Tax=Sediminivirga luteola TaxID=1774748 RepID=UPI001F55FB9E|nr:tripartite tricarboxylate transporter permease [Sediminivirga luteola]MCI2265143.1 tripartite tricarboxylate transporter permease [Sediminivirga luteola]